MPHFEPDVVELSPAAPGPRRLVGREGVLWLLAAGLMLFIGVLKGINLVIVLAYVLVGLWVMNGVLARRALQGLSARRLPRPPVQAGIPAEWTLEVHDAGPAGGSWVLEERVGDAVASWLVVRGGAGTVFRPRVRATFPRRGRYTVEPLTARSGFPFGLIRRRVVLAPADELIVLSRPARVDGERLRAWLFRAWAGSDEERRRVRRVVEREAEVHGLRDYRAGDSPRRVHWKATARRNRLIVREYEDAAPPRLTLVVDPWLPDRATEADRDHLEAVVSLAAGICREWRRGAGARLALVIGGHKPVALDGPPGPAWTERQLVALAETEGGETADLAGVLRGLSRAALAAPVLVVSSRPESPLAGAAGQALGRGAAFAYAGRPAGWFQLTG